MTITTQYSAIEQPDVARVNYRNVTYYCESWVNLADNQIEAKIFTKGEDGQIVLVDSSVVRVPGVGDTVDCPKVIGLDRTGTAASGLFVLHWVEGDFEGTITCRRSFFDLDTIVTGWQDQGTAALHGSALFDVCEIEGDDDEFVITRRTAAGLLTTLRATAPFAWGNFVWSVTTAVTIADRVLSCVASDTDDVVLLNYQQASLLNSVGLNASDGLGAVGPTEVFGDVLDGDNNFLAVGAVRVGADAYAVVAEASNDADFGVGGFNTYARLICYRAVTGTTAAVLDDSHWFYNAHLLSRPWAWASGTTGINEVYIGASFKSIQDGQEWNQTYGYVFRLDYQQWSIATTPGTVYPILASCMMDGSVDGRPHGASPAVLDFTVGSRMNHISHVAGPPEYDNGPDLKSVFFAHQAWTRLLASQTSDADRELAPVQASAGLVEFYHEDPWLTRRDTQEPTQPLENWVGIGHRAMSRPVELAGVLTFTGGVTQCYAGQQVVELGFPYAPEIFTASENVVGAIETAGTYYYIVTYIWADERGQLHRSPPSAPLSVVTGAASRSVDLVIRTMSFSMKDDTIRYPLAGPITVELWRTYILTGTTIEADAVGNYLFRRVFAGTTTNYRLEDTPANDRSDYRLDVNDNQLNAVIQYNELAPWQLNPTTLQFSPPPPIPHQPLTVATSWRNRLAGFDPARPEVFRYSEPILPLGTQYVVPEFLDTNEVRFDGFQEATAVQAMDYAVVVFTREAIYTIQGEPSTGGSVATLEVQTVVTGIGCIEPRSVVLTHLGIFFQSAKGMHILTRGFSVEDIGGPVEDLMRRAGNMRGGVHLVDSQQVRWVFNEEILAGPIYQPHILVYDYSTARWSTHTIPGFAQALGSSPLNQMQHATAWRGRQGNELMVFLQQFGLGIERALGDTVYNDEAAGGDEEITLLVQTEWIKVNELISGQFRIREIGVQTEMVNAGEMQIAVFYDNDGTFDETTADEVFNFANPAPEYLPCKPSRQKVSAFMLQIYELRAPETENRRFKSLLIRWMPKPTPLRYARSTLGT